MSHPINPDEKSEKKLKRKPLHLQFIYQFLADTHDHEFAQRFGLEGLLEQHDLIFDPKDHMTNWKKEAIIRVQKDTGRKMLGPILKKDFKKDFDEMLTERLDKYAADQERLLRRSGEEKDEKKDDGKEEEKYDEKEEEKDDEKTAVEPAKPTKSEEKEEKLTVEQVELRRNIYGYDFILKLVDQVNDDLQDFLDSQENEISDYIDRLAGEQIQKRMKTQVTIRYCLALFIIIAFILTIIALIYYLDAVPTSPYDTDRAGKESLYLNEIIAGCIFMGLAFILCCLLECRFKKQQPGLNISARDLMEHLSYETKEMREIKQSEEEKQENDPVIDAGGKLKKEFQLGLSMFRHMLSDRQVVAICEQLPDRLNRDLTKLFVTFLCDKPIVKYVYTHLLPDDDAAIQRDNSNEDKKEDSDDDGTFIVFLPPSEGREPTERVVFGSGELGIELQEIPSQERGNKLLPDSDEKAGDQKGAIPEIVLRGDLATRYSNLLYLHEKIEFGKKQRKQRAEREQRKKGKKQADLSIPLLDDDDT